MTMTTIVVAALALLVTGASGSWIGARRQGRVSPRRQRRALATLGEIAAHDPRAGAALPPGEVLPQAHVKLVGPGDDGPAPTPRPLTGGWRPTRARGAAPFRTPPPLHRVADPGVEPPGPPARLTPLDDPGDELGAVRLLRSPSSGSPPSSERSPSEARPAPSPSPTKDPAAAPGASAEAADRAAPDRAAPDRAVQPEPSTRGARGPQRSPAGQPVRFDDLEAPEPAGEPCEIPESLARSGPGSAERAEWAAALASARSAVAEAAPRKAPPGHRRARRGRRLLEASATAAVLAAAAVASVSSGVVGGHHHPGGLGHAASGAAASGASAGAKTGSGSPAAGPSRSGPSGPGTPGAGSSGGSAGSTQTVSVKLLSSSVGISVYQLSKQAPITLHASGRCWVEVRSGSSTGPVVYEATMSAGTTKALSGPVWVRLGNPTAVSVQVGATTVSPPVSSGNPYNLEFRTAQ